MVTRVTQVEIAKHIGVDVSSVNKILNRVDGPKFSKSTVSAVMKAAKKFGYKISPRAKSEYRRILMDLFPRNSAPVEIAMARGVPVPKAVEILDLLYRT